MNYSDDIGNSIQVLERRELDQYSEAGLDLGTSASFPVVKNRSLRFLRVMAISSSIPDKKADVERYLMEDVLSGIHGLNEPFVYLILGDGLTVEVYLGIFDSSEDNHTVLTGTLESTFPGIEIDSVADGNEHIWGFLDQCRYFGIMSGNPTAKLGNEEQGIEQVERLIRGVSRQTFGYMVVSEPVPDMDVLSAFENVTDIIREHSCHIRETTQHTRTSRTTVSGESLNRSVEYYVQQLELLLDKLNLAKAQGMWRVMTYFFSPDAPTAKKMSKLLKSVFSGEKSSPEAVRTIMLNGGNLTDVLGDFRRNELRANFNPSYTSKHPLDNIMGNGIASALNSRDLATLVHLPKEEMPGYAVKDTARFGVCFPEVKLSEKIRLGEILDRNRETGHEYQIAVNDLSKHGLIVGVTGSGKTNTCKNFLAQLWNGSTKTPFLVIEPAKSEYRALANVNGFEDLKVYTLGDESVSPFRLNPFEVMEGVRLQTHIDNLRAVFNASFVMYAPMPYILEVCIHEIYRDQGWDLTANRNRSLEVGGNVCEAFPTLTDLYEKIDPVVDAMGYDDRITMDIKAGLKVRIDSLRIGGKGSMLDTSRSIPMENLLSSPVVLELQSIGDDEEKAFMIGLLISRLYEYREIEYKNFGSNGLKHVTLVEEAHRLLSKTSSDVNNLEVVSTKAKAVETFCNILSEIRAYGEGILIAEQIPSKLAPDAVKNTNLKVMHRVVAKDDRDLVGDSMNLSEEQKRFVSTIDRGKAAAFSEGLDESFFVDVPYYGPLGDSVDGVSDGAVMRLMSGVSTGMDKIFGRHDGCRSCTRKCMYRDVTKEIFMISQCRDAFRKVLISSIENHRNLAPAFEELRTTILEQPSLHIEDEESNSLMFCFLITAGEGFIKENGQRYDLPNRKIVRLLSSYYDLVNNSFTGDRLYLDQGEGLNRFTNRYKDTFRVNSGPFPGCNEYCKLPCLFRYEIEPHVSDEGIDKRLLQAIKSKSQARAKVRALCMDVTKGVTAGNDDEFTENIALCFFIQKSVSWSVQEVRKNIEEWFYS